MGFRKMISGFRKFQQHHYHKDRALYEKLVTEGQSPKVMMIACSDSRIDPAIVTKSGPGELFTVRNIAAMVSPNEPEEDRTHHATASAVEYAVKHIKVEHIVVMGHALCGGIDALSRSTKLDDDKSYIGRWISIGADARDKVRSFFPTQTAEEHSQTLEKTTLLVSVNNLMTYPWVREAVEAGRLKLHAWYFDIRHGVLLNYNPVTNDFEDVLDKSVSAAMSHASIEKDATISITGYLNQLKECGCNEKKPQSVVGSAKGAVKKTKTKLKTAAQSAAVALGSPALIDSEICALAVELF